MTEDQLALLLQIQREPNSSFNYLQNHYPSGKVWNNQIVAKLIRELWEAGMIMPEGNDANKNHIILQPGLNAIEIHLAQQEKENQQSDLTYEKLNLEVETLRNKVWDYDATKNRAKDSLLYAKLAVLIALLGLAMQWMCNKPH